MALSDITQAAVQSAIEECRALGPAKFRAKYKFGKAREYLLRDGGRFYDSKAIVGAAHGYLPGRSALASDEFSGGEHTVRKRLEELGFSVLGPGELPSPGDVLSNDDLIRLFVVGIQGGMRRSRKSDLLLLVSDPFKGLYRDRWDGDILHYTGMAPTGDQSLAYAQNKTLAESVASQIPVHLVEAIREGEYTYAGRVALVGKPYQEDQIDDDGNMRKVWMFPLKLIEGRVPSLTIEQAIEIETAQAQLAHKCSLEDLKKRLKTAKQFPASRAAISFAFVRDAAVAEYTKRMAKGICDLCLSPAPFQNKRSEPYLECHHIVWLAKGGKDIVENTVALCPNCHRKMHIVNDKFDRGSLTTRAMQRAEDL
jgi:5-methylcytosine-specific restriction protein A